MHTMVEQEAPCDHIVMKVEYRATFITRIECVWHMPYGKLRSVSNNLPPLIVVNALTIARNPILYARTKHIEVLHHYVSLFAGPKHSGTCQQLHQWSILSCNSRSIHTISLVEKRLLGMQVGDGSSLIFSLQSPML